MEELDINNLCDFLKNNGFSEHTLNKIKDNLKALLVLLEMLPTTNFTKKGIKRARVEETILNGTSGFEIPKKDLIRFVKSEINVEEFIEQVSKTTQGRIQPYILCLQSEAGDKFFFNCRQQQN
ncbi:uncharacterized protein LOC117180297 [Belonocnema kinseyi]|uniref:uncharacterized protein LOC117180297 n=1 Tax=Belonocnema kinseyi TaxID=2817044 RepID=UPI00143CD2A5|nr:uncharacterized protein LOC117180297 [Belonocnema kinseyi]XP_033228605.1 uncharacterized protein LOC117180297 [Belonocnema kinseyi]